MRSSSKLNLKSSGLGEEEEEFVAGLLLVEDAESMLGTAKLEVDFEASKEASSRPEEAGFWASF